MEAIIRPATIADLPAIYALVKELAVYEKEPDAVTANLKDYQENFSEGIFESLVAESNNKIIGMALYYMAYSTWKGRMLYLEDFVISKSYRKEGIGQKLFDALLNVAKGKKAKLLKWQVLDWNMPAIRFYEKNNAIIEKDWWNGKINFD